MAPAEQLAFDVVKKCNHVMEHAEVEEIACACHACITEALLAAQRAERGRLLTIITAERQEAYAMAAGEALLALDRVIAAIRQLKQPKGENNDGKA